MHKDPISLNDLVIGLNRLTKTLVRFNYLSAHLAPDFLHWIFQSIPLLSAKAAYQPEAYSKALPYQTETQLYRSLEYLLHDLPKGMCLPHMAQRLTGYKRWVSDDGLWNAHYRQPDNIHVHRAVLKPGFSR